jgi:hypothetical protein
MSHGIRVAGIAVALAGLAGASEAWGRCDERAPRQASEDAAGVTRLEIEARAGSLRIVGREGAAQVAVTGTACARNAGDLEQVQIRTTRSGDTLRIRTEMPRGGNATLDLEVVMPRGLALRVDDSSGELEIEGSGTTSIADSSGSISVTDVDGVLEIDDSSGSIDVRRVSGDVRIEDGSGSIEVEGVGGSVVIEDDGAGAIRISEVEGDVHFEEDGSGGIVVRGVGGSFRVDRDGSGGVRYRDVNGEVSVPHR